MNVSLTPELEKFVIDRVKSGLYHSSSEVVREALRLLKEQDLLKESRLTELKNEIQQGKDSGSARKLDIEDVIDRGKKRFEQSRLREPGK
jgi:antitoxin ParD1/3/4